jgi:hypothetical protein
LICLQLPNTTAQVQQNNCDPVSGAQKKPQSTCLTPVYAQSTLVFACVCSNGIAPNASQWTQTIPYFECTEYNIQCQANCNGDSTCQANCVQQHPCGAQDPVKANITSTTATASATGTATTSGAGNVVYTGFGAGSASTATSSSKTGMSPRAMAIEIGQVYGLFMVVAGLMGGFALIL